jgi:paraquat-inducible protein A
MKGAPAHNPQALPVPLHKAVKLRWVLMVATVLFVLGLFLPMVTISKFIIARNSFSVVSGVVELLRNGRILLFLVVAGFSIALPALKLLVLFKLLSRAGTANPKTQRHLRLMHEYGRWAMLDVMVVAVLIVTVKLGAIASIDVHVGLYLFGAAVLLIMLVTKGVVGLTSNGGGLRGGPDL